MRSVLFEHLRVKDCGSDVDSIALNAARAVLRLAAFDGVCLDCNLSGDGFDDAALLAEVARVIQREIV